MLTPINSKIILNYIFKIFYKKDIDTASSTNLNPYVVFQAIQ